MHEMGIANSILDAARAETARYPSSRLSRVGIRLGEWAGVDTESLRFCFEALTTGTDMAGVQLEIDYRERAGDLDIAYLELEDLEGDSAQAAPGGPLCAVG